MTYQELVAEVQACASSMDAKAITDHLAVQFNVEGEGEGAFYLEISSGHISVEPYDYVDNDMTVIATAKQILDIFKGKMDPAKALEQGKIKAERNVGRIGLLNEIIKKTPVKKTTTAKKTATKKAAEAKPAEKKETAKAAPAKKEAEVKPAEKKETAKAAPAKKEAEVKPAEKKEAAKAAPAKKEAEVKPAEKKETVKAAPEKKETAKAALKKKTKK